MVSCWLEAGMKLYRITLSGYITELLHTGVLAEYAEKKEDGISSQATQIRHLRSYLTTPA